MGRSQLICLTHPGSIFFIYRLCAVETTQAYIALAGFALLGIAAIFLALSLWHFDVYLDKFRAFQERNFPTPSYSTCDDACVAEMAYWQSLSTQYALYGLLAGFSSSALLVFKFRVISGLILASLGLFVLYGLITDGTLCDLPDDRGLWDSVPVCNAMNFLVPTAMMATGGFLTVFGLHRRLPLPRLS